MSEILILGIYKNYKVGYEVIGFILSTNKFCKFNLKDIFNRQVRAWDIGATTKVEGFRRVDESNIEIIGDSILDRYFQKNELKEFLNDKKIDFMKFIKNTSIRFCVIKPRIIQNIYTRYNRFYIELISEGINRKIEIKDVRWTEYWNYVVNKNNNKLLKEKEIYYRDFLNNRESYFIGYKEIKEEKNINSRFKNSTSYINIASIFWF